MELKSAEEYIKEYKEERMKYLQGEIKNEDRKLRWLNGDLIRKVQEDTIEYANNLHDTLGDDQ